MVSGEESSRYRAVVIDAGAIIKGAGMRELHKAAEVYYTTSGVIDEVRDQKARMHLEQLPFEVHTREPTAAGYKRVAEFARLTGDYHQLSATDLQVLALVYDLELEGCGELAHIREKPKQVVGLGKLQAKTKTTPQDDSTTAKHTPSAASHLTPPSTEDYKTPNAEETLAPNHASNANAFNAPAPSPASDANSSSPQVDKPTTWASLVSRNATLASDIQQTPTTTTTTTDTTDPSITGAINAITITSDDSLGGQFSDAEDEEQHQHLPVHDKDQHFYSHPSQRNHHDDDHHDDEDAEFPSLTSLALDDKPPSTEQPHKPHNTETNKKKFYNSFPKYGNLVTPGGTLPLASTPNKTTKNIQAVEDKTPTQEQRRLHTDDAESSPSNTHKTRILGAAALVDQGPQVAHDDDGKGWVTTDNIQAVKAFGASSMLGKSTIPTTLQKAKEDSKQQQQQQQKQKRGPPLNMRCACATTDFAMQNVLLQMGFRLLTVDGMAIQRVKSWVTRCYACFTLQSLPGEGKIKASSSSATNLFCFKCGSDTLERIAATVDGETGCLKLHFSKRRRQKNLRGTKFSLPQSGKSNRYEGELILREDQLFTGAWSQKVRKGARKHDESIFGLDIAAGLGCVPGAAAVDDLSKREDIKVAFGRRNPNATKHGRERRGKKKKSSDRACGMRRY